MSAKKPDRLFKLPCFIAVVFGLFVLMCWACNVLVDYYSEEGGSL